MLTDKEVLLLFQAIPVISAQTLTVMDGVVTDCEKCQLPSQLTLTTHAMLM
jgi:hypothetical protein